MDAETKAALDAITEKLNSFAAKDGPIMKMVNAANGGTVKAVTAELDKFKETYQPPASVEEKPEKPTGETSPELSALTARLASVEGKLTETEKSNADLRSELRNKDIRTGILGHELTQSTMLPGEFTDTYMRKTGAENFELKSGQVYVKNGEDGYLTLDDSIAAFQQTKMGKLFAPPTAKPGSDSLTPEQKQQTEADKTKKLEQDLMAEWATI